MQHLAKKADLLLPNDSLLGEIMVEELDDGGMGSYLIVDPPFGGPTFLASEVEFTDSDGTKALASLYVGSDGVPCEVDIWKVDFSPLISLLDFDDEESLGT
ncbi:hypothetical protein [Luteibacter sp. SG786]|uniref:DUF6984 family protein n=1 Tax=Luteibacter sp. SG786 TaxID=2587130 RepID=UPI00141F5660|nr:hypothetical protein [Luteibacter sp. SG786]NII52787.1 hypothetical protein [Luteibacter sp. SG786]